MRGRIDSLRVESGNIKYSDPLTSFIYELLRDHLTCATVEVIISHIIAESGKEIAFTNGWLAQYAHNLADLIINADKVKKEFDADSVWKEFGEQSSGIVDNTNVKNSYNENDYKDDVNENIISGLEESKIALQAMIASGHLSEKDANDIKNEISDLLGNNANSDDNLQGEGAEDID